MAITPATQKRVRPSAATAPRLKREGFLVLGMHRSGTSSVAGMLAKLGVTAPKTLLTGLSDNERGHWESVPLMAFHDQLLASAGSKWDDWRAINDSWYETSVAADFKARGRALLAEEFGTAPSFVLKDPRICRFPRFWRDIFADEGIAANVIMPLRSPLEVAQSLRERNQFEIGQGLLLWLRHVLDAEAGTRDMARSIFEWNTLIDDWRSVVAGIERTLGTRLSAFTDLTAVEVDSFLSRDLQHERATDEELTVHPEVHAWIIEVYDALRNLAGGGPAASTYATLDRVRESLQDAGQLFGGLIAAADAKYARGQIALDAERAAFSRSEAEMGRRIDDLVEQQREIVAARDVVIEGLWAEREERGNEVDRLGSLVRTLEAEVAQLHAAKEDEMAEFLSKSEVGLSELAKRIVELEGEVDRLNSDIGAIRRSSSWRVTRPMRSLKRAADKLSGGGKRAIAAAGAVPLAGSRGVVRLAASYYFARRIVAEIRERGWKEVIKSSRHVLETEGSNALFSRARRVANVAHFVNPPGPQEVLDEKMIFLARSDVSSRPRTFARSPYVLIVTETTLEQCIKYRVDQKVTALAELGIRARGASLGDVYLIASHLQFCTSVIFYRCMSNELLIAWIEEARRLQIPVGFDADDPFFDRAALAQNANLGQLASYVLHNQMRDAERFHNGMRHADFLTVSTPGMADLARESFGPSFSKPIYIWRNLADHDAIALGNEAANDLRPASQPIRLGYFSGSLAHEADFAIAFPALETILSRRSDIELVIGGYCEMGRRLDRFGARVTFLPFEGYLAYLRAVRSCDLVLVPLVDGPSNNTKSTVRYIDASTQGRPVLASPVGDYANIITEGVDGFFSADNDWLASIEKCLESPDLLHEVGRRARTNILERFNVATYCRTLPPELIGTLSAGLVEPNSL